MRWCQKTLILGLTDKTKYKTTTIIKNGQPTLQAEMIKDLFTAGDALTKDNVKVELVTPRTKITTTQKYVNGLPVGTPTVVETKLSDVVERIYNWTPIGWEESV